MINTVLFDLDGTLLGLNEKEFMNLYFEEIGKKFCDICEPELLEKNIWDATKYMASNLEADKSNEAAFFERFNEMIDESHRAIYAERFVHFYHNEFDKVKASTYKVDNMLRAVKILKKKGYKLAIATNPLFPAVAVHKRIQWAGVDLEDFDYVTSFEKCHFCKPNVRFYEEVLERIGKKAEECMMVGNDEQDDLAAGKIGIKTYLITDNLIERNSGFNSDYKSDSRGFLRFVEALPDV